MDDDPSNIVLEPDFAEPRQDAKEAPILLSRPRGRKPPKASDGETSIFRPSQGRNVEPGEPEDLDAPAPNPRKKKKRRKDKLSATERKRAGRESFLEGLHRSLKFPVRPESILTILVMAVAYGSFTSVASFLKYGFFGFKGLAVLFIGTTMILGYFLYFLLQIFRLATIDEDDLPLTMEFDADLILMDIWVWLGSLWWSSLPLGVYWWVSARLMRWGIVAPGEWYLWGMGAVGVFCLILFPMSLMSAALHVSVFAANPWTVLHTIARVPTEYFASTCVYGTLLATAAAIGLLIPPFPPVAPILTQIVLWIMLFGALTATAYGMGNFYYRNRRKIDWFGELPKMTI